MKIDPCSKLVRGAALRRLPALALVAFTLASQPMFVYSAEIRRDPPKPAPVPSFNPARQPTTTGEFSVGVVTITFRDTALSSGMNEVAEALNIVKGAGQAADLGASDFHEGSGADSHGITQEVYFKIYSNDITWPKIVMMPNEATVYEDPHFYGYYCEYDYWENPFGWQDREEGSKRVEDMNKRALQLASKSYRGSRPMFLCYNYITTKPSVYEEDVNEMLLSFYNDRGGDPDRTRKTRTRRVRKRDIPDDIVNIDPWDYYAPEVKWGEPMWPNSKIQIMNSSGGVLAHEIGHCLGAPDVYRIGRYNDGIDGIASLMSYGPTANSFSRFYHHGYIKQQNHLVIDKPGTYTLHPRHIDPQGDQAVGYLIPSNHPHYAYHVEYIYDENATVGVGPAHEGMLISVVNLGRTNYLGSPDYFYTYRPNDPFFRGHGDTGNGLFGKRHGRTEFGPETEPASRLPNLLDGGIRIRNIEEHQGTLTFDLEINRKRFTGQEYTESMSPQIRLDGITNVQPTSFIMDCTIKFRGEPIKTDYGFCWSTSKNPTVRDATYNLQHRECYRGHAVDLKPDTTYYVRAYATNGVGLCYSDEELTVKTPPLVLERRGIEPLCTDSFSDNDYLISRYSIQYSAFAAESIDYSPTCVLAKLIAYYRPKRFDSVADEDSRASAVNFDHLNWNPGYDSYPPRLDEIDGFFQSVYEQSRSLNLHNSEPSRKFLSDFVKLTGVRSKPILSQLSQENLAKVSELINHDIAQSRPVLVIFYFSPEDSKWALIHGVDENGRFYVDFPKHSKLFLEDGERQMKTDHYAIDDLLQGRYKTHIITSCYDLR